MTGIDTGRRADAHRGAAPARLAAGLRDLWARFNADPDEAEQSLARLVWGIAVPSWIATTAGSSGSDGSLHVAMAAFYLTTLLIVAWKLTEPSASRARRIAAMACDAFFMFAFILEAGEAGALLWSIGPFICVGYGFRYGPDWLLGCFGLVLLADLALLMHPVWLAQPLVWAGLLAHLLITVPYLLLFLRRTRQANEALARANAEKSRILSVTSHNMRTPLSALMANLQLLAGADDAIERAQHHRAAWSAATVLLRQASTGLTLAALDHGRSAAPPSRVRLHAFAQDVLALVRPRAHRQGLVMSLRYDPALGEDVNIAAIPLQEALIALLDNAVKHTAQGSITLSIEAEGAQEARFCVSDTGHGIAAADLDRVFERFWQGSPRSGDGAVGAAGTGLGTGLGASLARELVEQAGGRIGVRSRLGEGSTFWFVLPCETARSDEPAAAPPASRSSPLDILVAEDEPATREALRRLLEGAGHRVGVFADGLTAWRQLLDRHWDTALIDGHLPGLDGHELIARIRSARDRSHQPRMVMLTADATSASRALADSVGADAWLAKPVEPARLLSALGPTEQKANPADPCPLAVRAADTLVIDPGLLELAQRSVYDSLADCCRAIDKADTVSAREALHRLRGTALLLGASAIAEAAQALEQSATLPAASGIAHLRARFDALFGTTAKVDA